MLTLLLLSIVPPLCLIAGLMIGHRLSRLETPLPSISDLRTSLAPTPPAAPSDTPPDDEGMAFPQMFIRTGDPPVESDFPGAIAAPPNALETVVKNWSNHD